MLLADRSVLGHVAPSLAHEPDWCAVDRLGLTSADKDGVWGRHESLNVAFWSREEKRDRDVKEQWIELELRYGEVGADRGNYRAGRYFQRWVPAKYAGCKSTDFLQRW